jgi:hypothetical protein
VFGSALGRFNLGKQWIIESMGSVYFVVIYT